MIVRRLNTMSSLADRAGVEFGKKMLEPPPQAKPPQRVARPWTALSTPSLTPGSGCAPKSFLG
ncbi:MAG TPA: hypothetical protein EYQ61_05600 [Dehalococcoidia bacterium]|jgi:hypothetical protein|nr:hypothetical protein [Dehalococcoidia bacterium]